MTTRGRPPGASKINAETGLTATQARILVAIEHHIKTVGYPPTLKEIGAAAGLVSPGSVGYQLERLTRKGFLRRGKGARQLVLVKNAEGR